jgi:hypothetical protein
VAAKNRIKVLIMKKILTLSLFLALPFIGEQAQAGSCSNAIREAQRQNFGNAGNVCADLDMGPKSNSPFVYVNPDGGCDLGLQLPGLPSFGGSLGSFDMCGLAKTITGGMVNQANGVMRDSMNTAIGGINQTAQQTIGTGVVNTNVNVSDVIKNNTIGSTPSYIP